MIAFLGLGRMGTPLAGRLVAAGHEVVVWNRTSDRTVPLTEAGAQVADSPADAVRGAEVVITMLADGPALESVAELVLPAIEPGAVWIEMSSVGPAVVRQLAERFPGLVDAPVMGSVDRAAAGTLTVLAGGDIDDVRELLELFGTVVPCGEVGAGAARKVLLITAAIGGVSLVADLVSLAGELGVPEPLDLLADGPLAGAVSRARSSTADFPVRLAAKDVGLALDASRSELLEAVYARLLEVPDQEADLSDVVRNRDR